MPHRLVAGETVELQIAAFHRDARAEAQVACVVFSATDGTNTVSQIVSYKATLDISTLADATLVTCNAEIYPWVGDAASVLDSAESSVAREFSPRYFYRDTALAAAPPIACVATAGNDDTGKVSTDLATAKTSPFLTVAGAFKAMLTALPSGDHAAGRRGYAAPLRPDLRGHLQAVLRGADDYP